MKRIKDKYLVVGADFAGYPLKEAVVEHLKGKGWKITDLESRAKAMPRIRKICFTVWDCAWERRSAKANLSVRCCFAEREWGSISRQVNVRT